MFGWLSDPTGKMERLTGGDCVNQRDAKAKGCRNFYFGGLRLDYFLEQLVEEDPGFTRCLGGWRDPKPRV